ncbi:MAG: sugar ABC transporter permease [Actinobacteria bacterium]|nr:sugar ABC transporter permease [Actinomycetota bacterium]
MAPHVTGWLFALPFVLVFAVFLALPILASFVLSFTNFGIANLQSWFSADVIGLDNYTKLFDDEKFLKAARNTGVFVLFGVPLTILFGLVAAVGLNQALGRVVALFRVGYYLPVVTSIVAIAVVWRYLLAPDAGLINLVLDGVGIGGPNWLGQRSTALGSIIALGVWRNLGFDMVVFLAALQGINPALYEAARVDGATSWHVFRRITVPLLRPAILFLTVITTAGYLQLFEEPFVMTGGGPLDSTLSVSMYVYQQGFTFLNLGYASAIAYALFVAIIVLAAIQFRLLRSDETQ